MSVFMYCPNCGYTVETTVRCTPDGESVEAVICKVCKMTLLES